MTTKTKSPVKDTLILQARPLIAALDRDDDNDAASATTMVHGPLLTSSVSLSFWGGIDPVTGIVIDQQHPLVGKNVAGSILVLPSGRGSCTASQVLLELILNDIGPKAILLRDADGLVAVGALIAQEVFGMTQHKNVPMIACLQDAGFAALLHCAAAHGATHAVVRRDGQVQVGNNPETLLLQQQSGGGEAVVDKTLQKFTEKEEHLLANASNPAERMALRVIFRYARILLFDEPEYTPVSKAHIDGCTYIGPGGLAFVQRLVEQGGRVSVPTTLNSVSTDRQRWRALGVPAEYAQNAIALGDAYLELGCLPSFTCAPYLLANPPKLGEDLVWGESNAVVYANSVLGARTEKYADYLDICGAIAGIVPRTGAHVPHNRVPRIVLDAQELFAKELSVRDESLDLDTLFPILGHLSGSLADGKVPILIGLEAWSKVVSADHLKAFCAAYGTTGTSPLIHIAGITPEALCTDIVQQWVDNCGDSRALVTLEGLASTHALLDSSQDERDTLPISIDLIALGNPHLSVSECKHLVDLVADVGASKQENVRIIGCISREIYNMADEQGLIRPLEDFGMEFISDTCWCMLLDPPVIPTNPNGATLTNSGKYAHYGPGLTNRRFRFAGTADCVKVATTGTIPMLKSTHGRRPSWLTSPYAIQQRPFHTIGLIRGCIPKTLRLELRTAAFASRRVLRLFRVW